MWLKKNKQRQIVGGEVTEVREGGRSCKTYKVMVTTLAFIVSGMGAKLSLQQGYELIRVSEDPSACCMESWYGSRKFSEEATAIVQVRDGDSGHSSSIQVMRNHWIWDIY